MQIQSYSPKYEKEVIALWERCNLVRPVNNPQKDIERKLKVNPELFLIGLIDGKVVATAVGGYEGHRGWVNYLGVDPSQQKKGLGRQIMRALEEKLLEKGCPKLNLQVLTTNTEAMKFYERIGYKKDDVISMGKRLISD
jgi:ribosomal protein S18 acetylase RimI-like enzyme